MNGTFCGRISYFVVAVLIYYIYRESTVFLTMPVRDAWNDPPVNAFQGVAFGVGIALVSILSNILFGFVEVKGINYKMLKFLPVIILGMTLTGLTEELVFRALPINALRPYVSDSVLVVGTALLFGMVHVQYSVYYGVAAFVAGLLLGYGFLEYGLFWAAGLHAAFNAVETSFYSTMKYRVKNPVIAGERKTPDDDGVGTSLVELVLVCYLKYTNYF